MAYSFKQIEAHDPSNPGLVAPNAMVTIFEPGDPAKTPLTLTTLDGQPIANPVTVNGLGYGPAFMHATLSQVAWAGGDLTGTFESYEGMRDEAIAARTAAENAAANAAAEAQTAIGDATVAAEAAADAADASALAAANSAALVGAPADNAIATAINATGSATKTALSATYGPSAAPMQAAFAPPVYSNTAWTPGSKAYPLAANQARIFGLGSSSMGNMGPEITDAIASQTWGATYTSMAWAGERLEHALARAGIVPAKLTFPSNTIPASGSATVTCDLPTLNFMKTYSGTVAGVAGTLSLASGVFTFTRTTAGTAVTTTAGADFIPAATKADGTPELPYFRDAVAILDVGKNNTGDAGSADRINAALDLLHEWLVPRVKTLVVLGQFADTNSTLTQKKNVAAVNAYRAAKYGSLFIDLKAYVTGSQIWTDTGITPTSTDLNQQANGEKPTSLSSDDLHLNAAAELAVVNKLIMPKLAAALGKPFYGPNPVTTSDAFTSSDMTSINGRITDATLGGEPSTWNASVTFALSSNKMTTGTATGIAALPVTVSDVELTVKVDTLPTANSILAQVRMKQQAAASTNDAYRATLTTAGTLTLVRRFGGSDATISAGAHTVTAGNTFGVRAVGNQISLLKNGVAVETVTDSNITNNPLVGIGTVSSTNAVLDDVKVRSITDVTKL